jgi:hypothetical protein
LTAALVVLPKGKPAYPGLFNLSFGFADKCLRQYMRDLADVIGAIDDPNTGSQAFSFGQTGTVNKLSIAINVQGQARPSDICGGGLAEIIHQTMAELWHPIVDVFKPEILLDLMHLSSRPPLFSAVDRIPPVSVAGSLGGIFNLFG